MISELEPHAFQGPLQIRYKFEFSTMIALEHVDSFMRQLTNNRITGEDAIETLVKQFEFDLRSKMKLHENPVLNSSNG